MIKKLLENFGRILAKENFLRGILLLAVLPLFFAGFFIYLRSLEYEQTAESFSYISQKAAKTWADRLLKKEFLEKYADPDPYFINTQLEKCHFLGSETKILAELSQHHVFQYDATLLQRLKFLQSEENRLSFTEEKVRTSPILKESEEHQVHPVEAGLADVEKILSLIEGVEIGRYLPVQESPQLLITNFCLEKTKNADKPLYFLTLDLLKREFLKKPKIEAVK